MRQYLDLVKHILENGSIREDRTGNGTIGVFGYQMRFNLSDGFPLVTTKKCHLKSIIHELLWFLSGDTNTKYLNDNGVSIWDEWALDNGDLGPVYGKMWRSWPTTNGGQIDQIQQLINGLKTSPFSRRHIVSGWNPELLPVEGNSHKDNVEAGKQALPPCHTIFQFYVNKNKDGEMVLSCQLYQRSADVMLGVPFNIASYALLTLMVAQVCGYKPGEFVHTLGDAHIYLNHIDGAKIQLSREPMSLPIMNIAQRNQNIFTFEYKDFVLENYHSHPRIDFKIAI